MTPDLTLLLYSVILYFILIMIPAQEAVMRNSARVQMGSRDDLPEPSTFNKRATRLRNNMAENLLIFGLLVILAHVTNSANTITELACQLFLGARIVHAITYLYYVPVVRTLMWAVWVVSYGMIISQLL